MSKSIESFIRENTEAVICPSCGKEYNISFTQKDYRISKECVRCFVLNRMFREER